MKFELKSASYYWEGGVKEKYGNLKEFNFDGRYIDISMMYELVHLGETVGYKLIYDPGNDSNIINDGLDGINGRPVFQKGKMKNGRKESKRKL